MAALNLRAERVLFGFMVAGLLGKALFYVGMFLWASKSETGAAALQGVVYADVFTWICFSLLEAPFQPARIVSGSVFEVVLLFVFFLRGAFFDISTDPVAMGVGILWFILFAALRAGIYGAEQTLRVTGVTQGTIAQQSRP